MRNINIQQKLEKAYSWYLIHGYDTVEYVYGQLPMNFEEWLNYQYHCGAFVERFAPKDVIWKPDGLGSIEDDMEFAFNAYEEYKAEHQCDLTDEEFEASENYKDNQMYIDACEYIKRMQNEDYYEASVLMRKYSPNYQYEQFTEFMQYVKDMSNF